MTKKHAIDLAIGVAILVAGVLLFVLSRQYSAWLAALPAVIVPLRSWFAAALPLEQWAAKQGLAVYHVGLRWSKSQNAFVHVIQLSPMKPSLLRQGYASAAKGLQMNLASAFAGLLNALTARIPNQSAASLALAGPANAAVAAYLASLTEDEVLAGLDKLAKSGDIDALLTKIPGLAALIPTPVATPAVVAK